MTSSTMYHSAGGTVEIPQVDPVGCDVLLWTLAGEYYFVEVVNGQIYHVLDNMLAALIDSWPTLTIGVLVNGKVGKIMPYPLQ